MKKGVMFLIAFLIFALVLFSVLYTDYIIEKKRSLTGEIITGNATSSNFAVSIGVVVGTAEINLTSPENKTYITPTNIRLNYTSANTYSIWYNLDSGSNTTLTANSTFNTTQGQHTLYLYANNTDGNLTLDNVTFTVNTTKFTVLYNGYSGSTRGSSTDFNKSSLEDLQNLSSVVLENTNYGKIGFSQSINMTADSNFSDNLLNLDSYANISSNHIEINSTALPNFNKSATLYIYGLTFSNPRVLKDGSVCSSSICTEINYSSGTFAFNVTEFSIYSAEETPGGSTGGTTGGGGGTVSKFDVIPKEIQITIKQGEIKEKILAITNTGTSKLTVYVNESKLTNFIKISTSSFSLNSGETKEVLLDFLATENAAPGLHIGKILVKSGSIEKEIIVALNIESRESLFDVDVSIPSKYQRVVPGEDVLANIKIYNLGEMSRVDASIDYEIRDEEGNKIKALSDTIAVETQVNFIKTINIPQNVPLGNYVLYVTVTYSGKVAGASVFFDVDKKDVSKKEQIFIVVIIILAIVISLITYFWIIHYRKEHRRGLGKSMIDLREVMKR